MKEIKILKFTFIKLVYSILILVFLISVFFPYYSKTYVFPPPPAVPTISYTKSYFGYIELIYGGWPGLILIVISLIILNPERKGKTLLVGGVGCVLIIINLMIRPSIQSITIRLGFYIGFIFCIGLFVINVFAFISKEGIITLNSDKRWKREPIVQIKPEKIKKVEIVEIDWEKRELAKKQAFDYIKKMHLKSRELPFYEIISKIGINRNDLEKIVGEMITNKEINAQVRDFVIIFKKVSEEKEEELPDIKKALGEKIAEIENVIKENRIDQAIKELEEAIEIAERYDFEDLIDEANQKLSQCKELDIKKKKEEELQRIEKNLLANLAEIDEFIEKKKIQDAIENLVELRRIAKERDFGDLIKTIDEKIENCKDLQLNNISKIRKTILNYSTKLTRLELVDISEKAAIQDEILIEKTIHEMIDGKEISAEYFSSSKSLAFYQQEKDVKPILAPKEMKNLRVFLSYSTLDDKRFKISDIVKSLDKYPEIKKASYWQADSKQNIVEFMENTLKNTDVFVLFCSKNSVKSNAVKDEWQAAFQMRKRGMLKIIPIYEDEDDVPVLLWQLLNVKFERDNFNGFIENLYKEILR